MSIFDVMGPVMVGPSSSHTAGACRLGLLANNILGEKVARVAIYLHGSFAETYRGHGTDVALLAGLMGWSTDDLRIPEAEQYAKAAGMEYSFNKIDLGGSAHPNTVLFELTGVSGRTCQVIGSSVGGGQVVVTEIDGFPVELTGKLPSLLVLHMDRRGMIAQVSTHIAKAGVNIATMRMFRNTKGGTAIMIFECDHQIPQEALDIISVLPLVESVRFVASVQ